MTYDEKVAAMRDFGGGHGSVYEKDELEGNGSSPPYRIAVLEHRTTDDESDLSVAVHSFASLAVRVGGYFTMNTFHGIQTMEHTVHMYLHVSRPLTDDEIEAAGGPKITRLTAAEMDAAIVKA